MRFKTWLIASLAALLLSPHLVHAESTLTSNDERLQIKVPAGYSEKAASKPTIRIEAVSNITGATIMVISDAQTHFASLAEYAQIVRDQIMGRLTDAQSDAGEKLQANGNPAIRYEITGISANHQRMAFSVTIIQTETRFNQVICACPRAVYADCKRDFLTVTGTFKELPEKNAPG